MKKRSRVGGDYGGVFSDMPPRIQRLGNIVDSGILKSTLKSEKEIPCSDKNGNIQGVAKIRDETRLNGTMRVQLDFVGRINPNVKDEMIEELRRFVKKYYL